MQGTRGGAEHWRRLPCLRKSVATFGEEPAGKHRASDLAMAQHVADQRRGRDLQQRQKDGLTRRSSCDEEMWLMPVRECVVGPTRMWGMHHHMCVVRQPH